MEAAELYRLVQGMAAMSGAADIGISFRTDETGCFQVPPRNLQPRKPETLRNLKTPKTRDSEPETCNRNSQPELEVAPETRNRNLQPATRNPRPATIWAT